jgi:hypothetical protein
MFNCVSLGSSFELTVGAEGEASGQVKEFMSLLAEQKLPKLTRIIFLWF